MSETSGFFISQGGDRRYTPDWLAKYIEALVTTGVYKDECAITAGSGMTVTMATGRAWIKGYLYLSDTVKTLTIANADSSMDRKDIIVLRLDLTARTIETRVIQGTPNTEPTAQALTRTADVWDLELAEITVPAGSSEITQDHIKDTRLDDNLCGITVSAVQHIPTAAFLEQMVESFSVWFDEIKGKLDTDQAGHLLQMIQALSYTRDFKAADWNDDDADCTITITAHEHGMSGNLAECRAYIKGPDGENDYRATAWAALETYATISDNGDIVLHYPGGTGYDGRVVLRMTQTARLDLMS